jgi:hypothetical protein
VAHTVKVIALGFALLAVCLIAGRLLGGADPKVVAQSALVFVALWFVGAGINMWLGVSKAGYSVAEELPFFFVVFLIPAVVALFVWSRCSRA